MGEINMNDEITRHFSSLAAGLIFGLLIWRHYRQKNLASASRYSTFWPRFLTGWVDNLVLWPIGFVTSVVFSFNIPKELAAFLIVMESLAWLIYTVTMHARYGQTVGKMVTKVRVVDFRTEGMISWKQAWLRESIPMLLSLVFLGWEIFLVLSGSVSPRTFRTSEAMAPGKGFWILMLIPFLWFVAEVLTMLTNEKRRALHDIIAGTVVVRTNSDSKHRDHVRKR